MRDQDFLLWLGARLEHHFKVDPGTDYLCKLEAIAKALPPGQETPNPGPVASYVGLKEEVHWLDAMIAALEARRRDVYDLSLAAPEEDKVCDDVTSELLGNDSLSRFLDKNRRVWPRQVDGLIWRKGTMGYIRSEPQLVKVRPVRGVVSDDDPGDKTYLGILVGDLPLSATVAHNEETGLLEIGLAMHNPCIVVPSIRKVVMGAGSWWARINKPEDLKDISDDQIKNVWYVKALMGEPKDKE